MNTVSKKKKNNVTVELFFYFFFFFIKVFLELRFFSYFGGNYLCLINCYFRILLWKINFTTTLRIESVDSLKKKKNYFNYLCATQWRSLRNYWPYPNKIYYVQNIRFLKHVCFRFYSELNLKKKKKKTPIDPFKFESSFCHWTVKA